MYGAFHFLRLLQTAQSIAHLDLREAPHIKLRVLNHWDNLDGHVERGYAGDSIWDWQKLPDYLDPRYTDYARANASIGINGTVLNNVNADAADPDAAVPGEGRGVGRCASPLWHPRLSQRPLQLRRSSSAD